MPGKSTKHIREMTMVYLEHVNIVVREMQSALDFYSTAFPHWKVRSQGSGDWYGSPRNWLHFGDDTQYLAMSDNGQGENRDLKSLNLGLAHFAFVVENVEALIKRMLDAGYEIAIPLNEEPFRKNVYFVDPSGFEVEFVEYLSDLPEERNLDA
ncbi:MAG: VOC family protein [Pseudomonadales bacterium]|nr:VOC family protein [Pseudomonadales bacterium]